MSQPYVSQIILFAGIFAPSGYLPCDGRLLAISEYDTLYSLIGTTYGGDGQTTFGLPDLRGRVPVHWGTGSSGTTYVQGQLAGVEAVTLGTNQLPIHTHSVLANSAAGNQGSPSAGYLAGGTATARYEATTPQTALSSQSVQSQGGSRPHDNLQPFQCLMFCISLFGVYPSRS
jgi:microcystin-dependent protein